jgi:hypothetical protein
MTKEFIEANMKKIQEHLEEARKLLALMNGAGILIVSADIEPGKAVANISCRGSNEQLSEALTQAAKASPEFKKIIMVAALKSNL